MRIPRLPPVLLAGMAVATQSWCARRSRPTPGSTVAGALLAATSAGLMVGAARAFHRAGTTLSPVEVDQASAVVASGPYRFSRNPMYVGIAGLLVSHAAVRRSWLACLPALAWIAVIDRVQIPAEEAALRDKFPTAYRDLLDRTPRWLGRPGRG
ncbi:MAG TPA: isoprenylcysteine carboxylmethyltransferase family protein [Candidatus Avipropionibacterium avicola]|uniref:Isoprenylcysteine carboxylmethyltransferase family protein n=1 Tax=Candidatus Avipropionibacterium avicola TaxID=2840701 RepID=A0A9D1H142_9ACTN|nr:isoprenylcysteine carboxylmethyltransferase family protein [Candidatus Avipropionibacterium avicola]